MKRKNALILGGLAGLTALALASGGYYLQAIKGHAEVMLAAESIDDIIQQPTTDDALRERLRLVQEMRDFASRELALPENESYRQYAEVGRDHMVWNLVALPEFSLEPKQWCYPVIGCQSYRGYFNKERAHRLAERLEAEGYEVMVRGAGAYSTLGRFADPVTDIMLRRNDLSLAEVIFHELAHQMVYVRGDTMFNESYATFVGEEGLRQWLRSQNERDTLERWQAHRNRIQIFNEMLRGYREQLQILYASELPEPEMRERKNEILGSVRVSFEQELVANYPEMTRLESWFDVPVSNVRLANIAVYRYWVGAFDTIYRELDGDWAAFHARVREISELPRETRTAVLYDYLPDAPAAQPLI